MSPSALIVRTSRNRKKLDKSTRWYVEANAESDVLEADRQIGRFADQVVVLIDSFLIHLIYFIIEIVGIQYEAW
jgi:hypothetical protein